MNLRRAFHFLACTVMLRLNSRKKAKRAKIAQSAPTRGEIARLSEGRGERTAGRRRNPQARTPALDDLRLLCFGAGGLALIKEQAIGFKGGEMLSRSQAAEILLLHKVQLPRKALGGAECEKRSGSAQEPVNEPPGGGERGEQPVENVNGGRGLGRDVELM